MSLPRKVNLSTRSTLSADGHVQEVIKGLALGFYQDPCKTRHSDSSLRLSRAPIRASIDSAKITASSAKLRSVNLSSLTYYQEMLQGLWSPTSWGFPECLPRGATLPLPYGDMPKKFQGENTKAAAARARKAEAKAEAECRKKQEQEDAFWRDDDKHVMKKEQRKDQKEKKRLEVMERKKENQRLLEEEDSKIKGRQPTAAKAPSKVTRAQIEETLRKEQEKSNEETKGNHIGCNAFLHWYCDRKQAGKDEMSETSQGGERNRVHRKTEGKRRAQEGG
ncbi:CC124 protein, partial [Polypterus senegalus]